MCYQINDRGGDVLLFALSLGILMGVFERAPQSITGSTVRKTLSWISGNKFTDPVPASDIRRAPTTTTTSTDYSWDSDESGDQGSVGLGSMAGDDVGNGVRVLDDEIVKSPVEI
jgi:hypothetical protein